MYLPNGGRSSSGGDKRLRARLLASRLRGGRGAAGRHRRIPRDGDQGHPCLRGEELIERSATNWVSRNPCSPRRQASAVTLPGVSPESGTGFRELSSVGEMEATSVP